MAFSEICGLEEWFPEGVRTNDAWSPSFAEAARERRGDRAPLEARPAAGERAHRCQQVVRRHLERELGDPFLGSRERRVASNEVSAAQAEAWAGQAALEDAGVSPKEVNAALAWALLPDRIMPSSACRASELLGLEGAWAASLDTACASPIAPLEVAAALV